MQRRLIGDVEVSLLGLGTSRLCSLGARVSRSDAARLLHTALDVGVTFVDTADTYGSSDCERLLGDLLATSGQRITIATKGGHTVADFPQPFRLLNQFAKKGLQFAGYRQNFEAGVIIRRIENSLRRLRRDVIDIYFLHQPPESALADDALIGALVDARTEGTIRCVGVASDDPGVLRAAATSGIFDVVQTAVNSKSSTNFAETAPILAAAGLPIVANQVLHGMREGRADAGLLLRHAAAQTGVRVVLCRTSSPDHLRENAAALDPPLTEQDRLTGCFR